MLTTVLRPVVVQTKLPPEIAAKCAIILKAVMEKTVTVIKQCGKWNFAFEAAAIATKRKKISPTLHTHSDSEARVRKPKRKKAKILRAETKADKKGTCLVLFILILLVEKQAVAVISSESPLTELVNELKASVAELTSTQKLQAAKINELESKLETVKAKAQKALIYAKVGANAAKQSAPVVVQPRYAQVPEPASPAIMPRYQQYQATPQGEASVHAMREMLREFGLACTPQHQSGYTPTPVPHAQYQQQPVGQQTSPATPHQSK